MQVTVTVTDRAGHSTSQQVEVVERSALQVGWSPPNSTVTDLTAQLAKFPGTKFVTLYSGPGGGLPSWTSGILPLVPADATLSLSIKDWPVGVAAWLSARPTGLPPFYLTLDHEPEQQDSGDPTPAEFRQEWQELIAALAGHPRRAEVRLMPTFTEYAATEGGNAATWEANFGVVSGYAGVDAVGFDIYDTGYPSYRTPQQAYGFALSHAAKYGRDLIIRERGIARKGTDDGTQVARNMRDQCAYLAANPRVRGWSWFYRGGQILDTRLPEKQALTDLIGEYQ